MVKQRKGAAKMDIQIMYFVQNDPKGPPSSVATEGETETNET
jgi:hypothetical protein